MTRILVLLGVAAAGAAAYFLVIRTEPQQAAVEPSAPAVVTPAEPGSATLGDQIRQAAETARTEVEVAAEQASEQLAEARDTAAEAAAEAIESASEAASQAAEAASEAASSAAEATTEAVGTAIAAANQETTAAIASARELVESWDGEGMLTQSGFDYDTMVAAVEDSTMNETLKTGILGILEDIRSAPEAIAVHAQALRALIGM